MAVSQDVVFLGTNTLLGASSGNSEAIWFSNGLTATEIAPFATLPLPYQGASYGYMIAGANIAGSLVLTAGQSFSGFASAALYATDPATGVPVALSSSVALPGQLSYLLDNLPASTGSVAIFADPAGNGLLRSDGTSAGTYEVPVAQAAAATSPSGLTNMDGLAALAFYRLGNNVLFEGTGADNQSDLFRTDGTASGTAEVVALPYLGATSTVPEFDPLATLNGRTIFVGPGAANVPGLWSTNGTAAGTIPLALLPPIPTSGGALAQSVAILGDQLIIAYDGGLYTTDGTVAGTASLGNLGATSQTRNVLPDSLAVIGDRVVFRVFIDNPGGTSMQLWTSDGTVAGTQQVVVANAGTLPDASAAPLNPDQITSIGALAVFSGGITQIPNPPGNATGVPDLWATNGTAAGTVDIGPALEPTDITAFGSKALFVGADAPGARTSGLWITDGTAAGTVEIAPGITSYGVITVAGGKAYLAGSVGLYVTDGTAAGTHLIPGTAGLEPEAITAVPSPLSFTGTQANYALSPTATGDLQVLDLTTPGATPLDLPNSRVLAFADGSSAMVDPTGSAQDIARLYLGAYGRAPDLSGLLTYTQELDAGTVSLAGIAATAPTSPQFLSTYGTLSDTQFVTRLYENADGRAPDPGGLAAYTGALASGQARGQVLLSIAESAEARVHSQAVAGDANDATVTRLYEAIDARAPDAGGLIGYASALDGGRSVQQIATAMLSGNEYTAKFGTPTDTAFVTDLYRNLLGRTPDASGLAAYTAALSGGEGRAQLVAGFINGDEAKLITAPLTHLGYVTTS